MKTNNTINTNLLMSGGGGKTKPPKEGEAVPNKQEPIKKKKNKK